MQLTFRCNADTVTLPPINGRSCTLRLTFLGRRDRQRSLGIRRHDQLADEVTEHGLYSFSSSSFI